MRFPSRPRVRARLTLLYGALFLGSGAVLLAITYVLVSNSPKTSTFLAWESVGTPGTGSSQPPVRRVAPPLSALNAAAQARAEATREHAAVLHQLLIESGVALIIMTALSLVLGWLVAGRILRPLRTMTTAIQQISAHNVQDRLAATGPLDEMRDLSDTVDGLLDRLAAAIEAHKRFVANAAHELRTPLTLEHALIEETLIDRDATLESFRATFARLLATRDQQARMLESLLTLATSERGLDRHERVDLAGLAELALRHRRDALRDGALRTVTDIRPAATLGDPALVERLIANLLDNAIDYNAPGGYVSVGTAVRGGLAVLRVVNSGAPIPAGTVDRLFEPFQRLRRTADRGGHHGLGLSIVRAIAAAHGASVTAAARPAGGLEVEVAFPAVPGLPHPVTVEVPTPQAAR